MNFKENKQLYRDNPRKKIKKGNNNNKNTKIKLNNNSAVKRMNKFLCSWMHASDQMRFHHSLQFWPKLQEREYLSEEWGWPYQERSAVTLDALSLEKKLTFYNWKWKVIQEKWKKKKTYHQNIFKVSSINEFQTKQTTVSR